MFNSIRILVKSTIAHVIASTYLQRHMDWPTEMLQCKAKRGGSTDKYLQHQINKKEDKKRFFLYLVHLPLNLAIFCGWKKQKGWIQFRIVNSRIHAHAHTHTYTWRIYIKDVGHEIIKQFDLFSFSVSNFFVFHFQLYGQSCNFEVKKCREPFE